MQVDSQWVARNLGFDPISLLHRRQHLHSREQPGLPAPRTFSARLLISIPKHRKDASSWHSRLQPGSLGTRTWRGRAGLAPKTGPTSTWAQQQPVASGRCTGRYLDGR